MSYERNLCLLDWDGSRELTFFLYYQSEGNRNRPQELTRTLGSGQGTSVQMSQQRGYQNSGRRQGWQTGSEKKIFTAPYTLKKQKGPNVQLAISTYRTRFHLAQHICNAAQPLWSGGPTETWDTRRQWTLPKLVVQLNLEPRPCPHWLAAPINDIWVIAGKPIVPQAGSNFLCVVVAATLTLLACPLW